MWSSRRKEEEEDWKREGHLSWAGWFPLSAQIGWISDWLPFSLSLCCFSLSVFTNASRIVCHTQEEQSSYSARSSPPPPPQDWSLPFASAKSGAFLPYLARIADLLSVVARGEKVADSVSHLGSGPVAAAAAGGRMRQIADHMQIMFLRPAVRRERESQSGL